MAAPLRPVGGANRYRCDQRDEKDDRVAHNQLSAISSQQSAVSCQLPAISFQPSVLQSSATIFQHIAFDIRAFAFVHSCIRAFFLHGFVSLFS
jgi:hypothetical protein